jgi:hypothetical protein
MRNGLLLASLVLSGVVGCASSPAAPFDSFKNVPITAFRLQNYEPPPQAAAAPPTAPGMIPGLPPEIQQWVQAGASMLPPGLLPQGLLPGQPAAAAPSAQQDMTPRFHGFRILGQANVMDEGLRQELINVFGFDKNFDNTHASCVYAEFGFSFARSGQPPADVLVSLSCDQVQAQNFLWPFAQTGLTPDSVQRITKVTRSVFGG